MEADDWRTIAASTNPSVDNVRRAAAAHPLDFFRGRDFAGRYLLSLAASSGAADLPERPRLNGIRVAVEQTAPDAARLVLTLEDQSQFDIFRALAAHLLDATAGLPRGANGDGIRLVLQRLRDWHNLLRRGLENTLSQAEVLGLTGELLFLRDEILPRATPDAALPAWRSLRDEQDFAFGGWLIEVKTQMSTADQRVRISSAQQLDTTSGRILLCHQTVAPCGADAEGAVTLNSIVAEIYGLIGSSGDAVQAFEAVLSGWPYLNRPEYDRPVVLPTQRRLFEVREGFPRIVPSMIPGGLEKISYEIPVAQLIPFAVDQATVLDSVFT
jgi:hypothetical protein